MRCACHNGQCRGCPRNCKRRADNHEYHWGRLILGRWLKATTREPGNLLPVMVMHARVGRGVPKRWKSRVDLPQQGRKADCTGNVLDGLDVRRRVSSCLFSQSLCLSRSFMGRPAMCARQKRSFQSYPVRHDRSGWSCCCLLQQQGPHRRKPPPRPDKARACLNRWWFRPPSLDTLR